MASTLLISFCITVASLRYNIPVKLIDSVIQIESNYVADATGMLDDIGLMQIRHTLVDETRQQLLDPCTNIMVGTRILENSKRHCKYTDDFSYLVCYNRGNTGGSKLRTPLSNKYYKKVMTIYGKDKILIFR